MTKLPDRQVPASFKDGRYIVLLKAPAAASYDGGSAGLARTAPSAGHAFNARSAAVQSYSRALVTRQNSIAAKVNAKPQYHYTIASNGFSAQLRSTQAGALAKNPAVLAVVPVEARKLDAASNNTANFLGMYGKKGVWNRHGGQRNAGAGVVVGDLDTGIWPESPSFRGKPLSATPTGDWASAMDPLGNTTMQKKDGSTFHGACETGEGWGLGDCSTKIIGARYYPDSFVAGVPAEHRSPAEFISTRDGDGHGSHTASTAAGKVTDGVVVGGVNFGEVTGMVPGAAIAAYKVCWEDDDEDTGGCYTDASLAAIDDAVRDGVDVINYSISGATDTVVDPVEIAFAGAANAGVFVAASAGNSGPDASTVAHNSPWLTTVAASSYRTFDGTVVLGDGQKFLGSTISNTGVPEQTPLIDSSNAPASGATADDATLCAPDSLDDSAVAGKIVVCLRGVYDRVAKSAEVKRAGGVGMILVNPSENSLNADFHSVPTVHIAVGDANAVYDYADNAADPTAALLPGNETDLKSEPVPQVAGYSSRGPADANESDILKPDIAAPGSDVLAAVAPPSNSDRRYDIYSGTSMAAPHITGLGAYLLAVHPRWTPQQVQSAMMTTATRTKDEVGGVSRDAFAQGAGEVTPSAMFKPGLFITSTPAQWYGLITHEGYDTGAPSVDPKAVNVPSMADHAVTGSTSFTRTITSGRAGTWRVKVWVPGLSADAPSTLTFDKKGESKPLDVTFNVNDDTPLNEWAMGYVTLIGPTTVRMPVALKPVALDVPATITGEGTDGSTDVTVTSGTNGSIDMATEGLAKADSTDDSVAAGDYNLYCVDVDPDTHVLRIDVDSADDSADLDLYTYTATAGCGSLTDYGPTSATSSADESVTIEDPTAAAYLIEVDGFAAGSQGSPMDFRLDTYDISPASTLGDLTVTPDPLPVTRGEDATFNVAWSGLDPASRYLGLVNYGDTGLSSVLEVTTPAG
ncbi:MAG TPA: S8 family serine peptidase [Nocardioides sp.]|nr:S8 family serine peptidase [Nocardioides sp.]